MKKNTLLLGLVVLSILMCAGAVSAYSYGTGSFYNSNYYTYPVYGTSPYNVRIGGTFGNGAAYVYGLKPGTINKPCPQLVPPYYIGKGCFGATGYNSGYSSYSYGSYGGYGSSYSGWGSLSQPRYYGSGGYSNPYVYSGGL